MLSFYQRVHCIIRNYFSFLVLWINRIHFCWEYVMPVSSPCSLHSFFFARAIYFHWVTPLTSPFRTIFDYVSFQRARMTFISQTSSRISHILVKLVLLRIVWVYCAFCYLWSYWHALLLVMMFEWRKVRTSGHLITSTLVSCRKAIQSRVTVVSLSCWSVTLYWRNVERNTGSIMVHTYISVCLGSQITLGDNLTCLPSMTDTFSNHYTPSTNRPRSTTHWWT